MRLHEHLDYWARERPDSEFAVHQDRRFTYEQALAATNRLANALVGAGLCKGDRAAILGKNSIQYLLLYYAASKVGVVPVPLNYRAAGPEWAHIVADAGAKLVIAGGEYLPAAQRIWTDLPAADLDTMGAGQPDTPPEQDVAEDDDLYQLYTSGTTGRPKGAVLTHRAVTANTAQIALLPHRGPPGERSLVMAPLCHAAAVWTAFAPISWGASLFIQHDFDAPELIRVLSQERIGYAVLVPTVIQACLALPEAAQRRYQDLRLIHTGAAPIAEATLRRAVEVFGCDVVQGYGMTETSAGVSAMTPADTRRALAGRPELLGSCGRPFAGTDVRIVDTHGAALPAGEVGEIVVRGPQLMRGYWHLPEATAEVLDGGWLRTGDAGAVDEEGYLYIRDRVKDVIVSGGENVYSRMVEDVLLAHPAIAEAAVIGVPDEHWGETVKAVVVLRPETQMTEGEIIQFCKGRLGGFQRPRSVDFVDELPRTTLGKVRKRELREPYWTGQVLSVAGA